MKIVVLDGYTANPGDLSWEGFEKLGELICYDRTPTGDEAEIAARIGDADAVITHTTPISRAVLAYCANLRYIGALSVDTGAVDTVAAKERGIHVTHVPDFSAQSEAQFAIALLLEICHHAGEHGNSVRNGDWENCEDFCYWLYPLIELSGKTMGIIGHTPAGQAAGKIAEALGMKLLYADIRENDVLEDVGFETLLRESDVISLHCPLTPRTEGIIGKKNIKKMKDGVIILNTAHGRLIVEQDLADALNTEKVCAAGLDSVSMEPVKGDNPLLFAKNCIVTPHIGWAAKESRARLLAAAVDNLEHFIASRSNNLAGS